MLLGVRWMSENVTNNLQGSTSEGFIDRLRIHVRAGTGGQGSIRQGAVGGDGGDVYVEATKHIASLNHIAAERRIKAENGENGTSKLKARKGKDTVIKVPVGTVVSTEKGQVIADLSREGEAEIIAYGGEGGSPLTNPQQSGLKGDKLHVILELKTIADVGLVGFPNAGKSSLLSALSRARPKIASYPFTTLRPNIGTVEYADMYSLAIADIPGLIEGAHMNYGMGHNFLRHIERTQVLLYVLDLGGFQLSADSPFRAPIEALRLLASELDMYQRRLRSSRPAMIALNKIDIPNSEDAYKQFMADYSKLQEEDRHFRRVSVIPISAQAGLGLDTLVVELRKLVESERRRRKEQDAKNFDVSKASFEDYLHSRDADTIRYFREDVKRFQ